MRARKVVDALPVFTPALLDVADLEADDVRDSRATDLDDNLLTDFEQLSSLPILYSQQRRGKEGVGLIHLVAGLRFSLGALVRVTDSREELGFTDRYVVGESVRRMAPLAAEVAARIGHHRGSQRPMPFARVNFVAAYQMPDELMRRHVQAHAESYLALEPLMHRRQRRYLLPDSE